MKYIKFNDRIVDSSMYRQLQDIAHILTDNQHFTFEQSFGHQINPQKMLISASHFWDLYEEKKQARSSWAPFGYPLVFCLYCPCADISL